MARVPEPVAGVQVIPVQDGVEGQEVGALRLPPPEGTQREHHDVTRAERHIHRQGAVGDALAAAQRAGEQHIVGIGRETQHDARAGTGRDGPESSTTAARAASRASTCRPAAATAASTTSAAGCGRRRGRRCVTRIRAAKCGWAPHSA